MKKIAFVIKGKTFLRAVGTLIHFSIKNQEKMGIKPTLFYYERRRGKEYDSIDREKLQSMFDIEMSPIEDDFHVECLVKDYDGVIAQDMHWHFPFLVGKLKTFSISLFFDALHYAAEHRNGSNAIPTMTYFPDGWFKDKFNELMGAEWPSRVMGSPTYDHSLFVADSCFTANKKRILFLSPPQQSLKQEAVDGINELIDYCHKHDIDFIIKDRQKTPWKNSDFNKIIHIKEEAGFPYTSMTLLKKSDMHITAYGTSVFESSFLGKHALNINDIVKSAGKNHVISSYGADFYYDNELCKPYSGNFIADCEAILNKEPMRPKREITVEDNYSIDILDDIIKLI